MKPSPSFYKSAVSRQTEWWRSLRSFLLVMTVPLAALGQANYATPYTIATLAGGQIGYMNGTGNGAQFSSPQGVAVDSAGNIYVADSGNKAIRQVTPTGVVTKLVRGGVLISPYGVAVDSGTNIYVADYGGGAIRKVTPVGTNWELSTLTGGFSAPYGAAVDDATNLYVADQGTSLIRKVTLVGTNWVVTTIAGPGGFNGPCGVAVDSATNVYVAGGDNDTIQKLTPVGTNWVVTTLAGLAGSPGTNDGTGTNAQFDFPAGVMVDAATNLYVADQLNSTIRKITPVGTNWVVTTLAGLAGSVGTNDGTGWAARFDSPAAVAMDKAGDLYVADVQSNRIRRGFPANGTPVILTNGTGLAFSNGQFGFYLTAAAGQAVVVDASTDLVTWLPIWTNTVGPGVLPFIDPQSEAYSNQFYRAHLPYPRRPLGVYAKVVISDVIKPNTNADWNSYFDCFYSNLISNPAISGLTLQVHWDLVNTAPGVYNWDYITNAFDEVSNWNTLNPNAQKTIQFIVTPGFNSPQWLLTNIASSDGSCDGLFNGEGASNNCGTVTFVGYNENADGNVLPLPWNQTYKAAWSNFLCELNKQFGADPLFVSISVAGPTAGSEEMILPNNGNTCPCHTNKPSCDTKCPSGTNAEPQPNGEMPDQMWNQLLTNHFGPSENHSNDQFIQEWEDAIDLYDGIFHGVTLVVTPGDGEGFPFGDATSTTNSLCQYSTNTSCTAVASILAYFENYRTVNGNGKATQVSGLAGSTDTLTNGDAGMGGVKLLSTLSQTSNPWNQILGGAQFDHSFSECLPSDCAPNPEQGEFNVLANFFNGTPAVNGTATFPGLFLAVSNESMINPPLTSPALLNYLQVYNQDVQYAESNGCTWIDDTGGTNGVQNLYVSAQDLLNQASELLLMIDETTYPRGAAPSYPPVCSPSPPPACNPP
jgi:sugar lactone lactonase YvrE